MAQLIDKDALVAEIEKRIKKLQDLFKEGEKKLDSFQKTAILLCIGECKVVLNILDTIEVKDIDLEKELKKIEQNPAWSEDDSFRTETLISVIKSGGSIRPELRNEFVNWLKSLKQRIGG